MLEDAGRGVVGRQKDVRERLVVAHQHVETRAQTLDQVRLEQQRFRFGACDDELHRCRLAHHAADAMSVETALRVIGDALLQAARLADVKHVAGGVHHAIDAWRVGQPLGELLDDVGARLAIGVACRDVPFDLGEIDVRAAGGKLLFLVVHLDIVARHVAGDVIAGAPARRFRRRRLVRISGVHSLMPVTSGVCQARCWPPSSAIIWPVTERACQR